jgi:hypothetical protein
MLVSYLFGKKRKNIKKIVSRRTYSRRK